MKKERNKGPQIRRRLSKQYSLIWKFYDPVIIGSILSVYLIIYFFPIKFIPDFFHLGEIESFRTLIWSLLTVTLGFSGLILTLLLLSYNFYFKSTRRNTVEFIFENINFKILFSAFISIILIHLLGYLMICRENQIEKLAVMYLLLILTVGYIILQFPLAILGLKYSTSIEKINKIITSVTSEDVEYLTDSAAFLEKHKIEDIESNRIITLKDIGLNAIKDGDWILPQAILNGTYELVIDSYKNECPIATKHESIYVFLWMTNHFSRIAIKNSDQIIVNVIAGFSFRLYHLLCQNNERATNYFTRLDNNLKDFVTSLIQSKDFKEIREGLVRDYVEVMSATVNTIEHSDEELPTDNYIALTEGKSIYNSKHYEIWSYATHYQADVLIFIIETAILRNDEIVYDRFNWQIWSLISAVEKSKLTDTQKISYLDNLLSRTRKLVKLAVKNDLQNVLDIVSHMHIVNWIIKGWTSVYNSAMFGNASTLTSMLREQKSYTTLLDDFFMVGRRIAHEDIDLKVKLDILGYIFDKGLKWYENRSESRQQKYDLQHQISWLFTNYVKGKEQMVELEKSHTAKIEEALIGYNYADYPEYRSY